MKIHEIFAISDHFDNLFYSNTTFSKLYTVLCHEMMLSYGYVLILLDVLLHSMSGAIISLGRVRVDTFASFNICKY